MEFMCGVLCSVVICNGVRDSGVRCLSGAVCLDNTGMTSSCYEARLCSTFTQC